MSGNGLRNKVADLLSFADVEIQGDRPWDIQIHNWDDLKETYNERFYRMWKYYLLSCVGSFRARKNQLWQIVLSPEGLPGGYDSLR